VILDDRPSNLDHLHELKRLGSRIALDDFGTGYSSLSYLSRFPIDVVKLDRTFIRDFDNPLTVALTRGIVDLAHSLELTTIAEGIETDEQLRSLRTLGCDHGQGFGLAMPLPSGELAPLFDPLWQPRAVRAEHEPVDVAVESPVDVPVDPPGEVPDQAPTVSGGQPS